MSGADRHLVLGGSPETVFRSEECGECDVASLQKRRDVLQGTIDRGLMAKRSRTHPPPGRSSSGA